MNTPLALDPLTMPLGGVRLIEASAGTGKTFTIAALYVRAVLGHGLPAPLMPPQILVVTFTEAATQELRERIRARLVDAARAFRAQQPGDPFLVGLIAAIPANEHAGCARRLELAAEWMDEAAVFTIHGWSQRMLLQHAFGSGHPFEQTLEPQDGELLAECVRDYWRTMFYPLGPGALAGVLSQWKDPDTLMQSLKPLLARGEAVLRANGAVLVEPDALAELLAGYDHWQVEHDARESMARDAWSGAADALSASVLAAVDNRILNGNAYRRKSVEEHLAGLRGWAAGEPLDLAILSRYAQARLDKATNKGKQTPTHAAFAALQSLTAHDEARPALRHAIIAHALVWVAECFERQKRLRAQMGFDDLLSRLDRALQGAGGPALAAAIGTQFPLAMIDEFQDTDSLQYRIFRTIYTSTETATGLLLIGDPKQAIYAFRGADIHTYLQARQEAEAPQFSLDKNYRSTAALVEAANTLFAHGERHAAGAFGFGAGLPFVSVAASGRNDTFTVDGVAPAAMQIALLDDPVAPVGVRYYRERMAAACADEIARLLTLAAQGRCGFAGDGSLQPRDIAILVRSRGEAEEMRAALRARRVRNVYLSDRDSIFASTEAGDVLFWLRACAEPTLDRRLRGALATRTLALGFADIDRLNTDELYWERRGREFLLLRELWQRQGVLAMLQRLLHIFDLPARLLAREGGERALTNVLHLAELLQEAAANLDGEQALIRYLAEQLVDARATSSDEHIVRLESDADLVRVVTVHKSKGLEYPLVFVPFACTWKDIKSGPGGYRYNDGQSGPQIELVARSAADAGDAVEQARQLAERARLQEDLRILYVAVTRAQHVCWLGVAPVAIGNAKKPQVQRSAFGYLLSGGAEIDNGQFRPLLDALVAGSEHIRVHELDDAAPVLLDAPTASLQLDAARTDLPPVAERWWIASYSALRYDDQAAPLPAPDTAREDVAVEYAMVGAQDPGGGDATTLPGFARGAEAGTFLHDLFEWMAEEGFARTAADPIALRDVIARKCQRRGWLSAIEPLARALPQLLAAPMDLPGGGRVALAELGDGPLYRAELEFWFAAEGVDTLALDRLVTAHTLPGVARPPLLPERVNGMLKGFIDLIFEHEGRFYVADYKSNWLGGKVEDYGHDALRESIAHSRYDLQYAIYLLALHRQLRTRLGAHYDYDTHIGGAVYLYLRGVDGTGHGVIGERPPRALIEAMDRLFSGEATP